MSHIIDNHFSESENKRSPWGPAQHETIFGTTGIRFLSCAGHGGFVLSGKANKRIPKAFRIRGGAYEEDCDCNIVFSFLFDDMHEMAVADNYEKWNALLDKGTKERALDNLQTAYSYPANWAVHSGESLTKEAFDAIKNDTSDNKRVTIGYKDHDAYLAQVEKIKENIVKKAFKPKHGLILRFKSAFEFTTGGETIKLTDFKLVDNNCFKGRRSIWRFRPVDPNHSFLANLTSWRNTPFDIIEA